MCQASHTASCTKARLVIAECLLRIELLQCLQQYCQQSPARIAREQVDVTKLWTTFVPLFMLLFATGCNQRMDVQPRVNALDKSDFFADGMAARQSPPGTVARGNLRLDEHYFLGLVAGKPADTFPSRLLKDQQAESLLIRGQQRYNIFCAPCHDAVGQGQGMVVQRGFPAPPSLHLDRLRAAPVGHFYNVISRGFGRMYPYASQVPVEDRWAIVAYIRALQYSQHAPVEDLPEETRQKLMPQFTTPDKVFLLD